MSEIIDILDKTAEKEKAITSDLLNQISNKIIALNMEDLSKHIATILSKLGVLLQKKDGTELSDILLNTLPKFTEKMLADEDIKYELSLTPDLAFNLKIGENSVGIQIKDGNLSVGTGIEQPDFFIELSIQILGKIFTGEENLMQELMAGERIKLWREQEPYNASKLLELTPLLSLILDKLNLDKWM